MAWQVLRIAVFKLPSTVLTQRKHGKVSERPVNVCATITGSCRQPARVTAAKQASPSDDAGGGREMGLGHALDLVTVVRRDGKQREPLRISFVAGRDGHDERDFVRASASALAAVQLALLAAQDGVVHLDTAVELSLGLVGLHHGIELLAHEPGPVVLDAELAGEFAARDRVLRLRDEKHSLEPLYERQERLGEDGAGLERGLNPARVALVQPALARHRVLASAASWTREAVWPAPAPHGRLALLFRTVSPLELGKAQALLELDRVARQRRPPCVLKSPKDLKTLRLPSEVCG